METLGPRDARSAAASEWTDRSRSVGGNKIAIDSGNIVELVDE